MRPSIRDTVRRHPEGITISLVILISLAFAVITQGNCCRRRCRFKLFPRCIRYQNKIWSIYR
jgi:hypothetical protein